jgi:hypothetical protein
MAMQGARRIAAGINPPRKAARDAQTLAKEGLNKSRSLSWRRCALRNDNSFRLFLEYRHQGALQWRGQNKGNKFRHSSKRGIWSWVKEILNKSSLRGALLAFSRERSAAGRGNPEIACQSKHWIASRRATLAVAMTDVRTCSGLP